MAKLDELKSDFLGSVRLFSGLDQDELRRIKTMVVFREVRRNEVLLREEDTNEYMYIVLAGEVKAVQVTSDGREIILAIHSSGDSFGEMSLIDGMTSPANVVATDNSLIALISKRVFHRMLADYDKVRENLLRILCGRLRHSLNRARILNLRGASQRVRMYLLSISADSGRRSSSGVTINLKLTHQNIADAVGLARESVTRAIDKWKREGQITVKKKFFHLNPSFFR